MSAWAAFWLAAGLFAIGLSAVVTAGHGPVGVSVGLNLGAIVAVVVAGNLIDGGRGR